MRGAHFSLLGLDRIVIMNFLVQLDAQFLYLFQVGRVVGIAANAFVFDDERLDLLVPEYGADPAAACRANGGCDSKNMRVSLSCQRRPTGRLDTP